MYNIELLLKYGDPVFFLYKGQIIDMFVKNIRISDRITYDAGIDINKHMRYKAPYGVIFHPDDMKENNVYLTREEAEKALEENDD